MPGKSTPFTPSSILFRPRQNPLWPIDDALGARQNERALVEAPGTAPESDELITTTIYHHSRTSRHPEYRPIMREKKVCLEVMCERYLFFDKYVAPLRRLLFSRYGGLRDLRIG